MTEDEKKIRLEVEEAEVKILTKADKTCGVKAEGEAKIVAVGDI